MSRIKTGHPKDKPTPRHIFTDHEWVRQHENELRDTYGERYIVVYLEAVYGVGDTYQAALADAEHNLPPEIDEIELMVDSLHRWHPFLRIVPHSEG